MPIDYPRAALAGFTLIVLLAVIVAGSTSGTSFSTYNPAWDGTADFRSIADSTETEQVVARNTSAYRTSNPNRTLAIILSPETAYGNSQSLEIRQFVRDGGTVLVADDFGSNGNRLLQDIGAQARFDGSRLRDERHYDGSPSLPVTSNVTSHSLTTGVEHLTLNHGTAITIEEGTESSDLATDTPVSILVESSQYAYLDQNGNDALDDDENLSASPVVTVESVGDGRVIAVSDPSIFINSMLARSDNRVFARNLYEHHDQVIVDVSRAGDVPPLQGALLTLRETPILQAVLGGAALAFIARWESIKAGARSLHRRLRSQQSVATPPEREEVIASIQMRHPDWDDERVERITQAIMNRQSKGWHDE